MLSGNYNVINNRDVDAAKGMDQLAGQLVVIRRWLDASGWVIVRKDDRCSLMPDRSLDNMPGMHERVLHSAFAYERRIENSELRIKADDIEYFFRATCHKRDKIFSGSFRGIQQQLQKYSKACEYV